MSYDDWKTTEPDGWQEPDDRYLTPAEEEELWQLEQLHEMLSEAGALLDRACAIEGRAGKVSLMSQALEVFSKYELRMKERSNDCG